MDRSNTRVREARPEDAKRLSGMRYDFRAAEDRAAEDRQAFLDRCGPWMRARLIGFEPAGADMYQLRLDEGS